MTTFIKAILAGMCISFGACVYLSVHDKVLGAVFFSFGLLTILLFKLKLFTGAVGYWKNGVTLKDLAIIWFGNLFGCALFCYGLIVFSAFHSVKFGSIIFASTALIDSKFNCFLNYDINSLIGLFSAAILCGILMFIAVDCFNNKELPDVTKTLVVVFAVSIFIIIGAEHVIADMAYMFLGYNPKITLFDRIVFLLICTLGNGVGSLLFYQGTRKK